MRLVTSVPHEVDGDGIRATVRLQRGQEAAWVLVCGDPDGRDAAAALSDTGADGARRPTPRTDPWSAQRSHQAQCDGAAEALTYGRAAPSSRRPRPHSPNGSASDGTGTIATPGCVTSRSWSARCGSRRVRKSRSSTWIGSPERSAGWMTSTFRSCTASRGSATSPSTPSATWTGSAGHARYASATRPGPRPSST